MKLWSKFLIIMFAIAAIAGCSKHSESLDQGREPIDDGNVVYMNVNLQLPAVPGTRSVTGENGGTESGTETGQDYENGVSSLLLVLAEKDYTYIAHGLAGVLSVKNDGLVSATAAITQTALSNYYDKKTGNNRSAALPQGAENIYVFAYCNPPKDLLDVFDKRDESAPKAWVDAYCQVIGKNYEPGDDVIGATDGSNRSIWAKGSFLMSNAELTEVEIPRTFDDWLVKYAEINSPLEFTKTVPVERSVARFDFKDGSPANTPANTYIIDKVTGQQGGALRVQLVRMALVNMSKNFYYLKRISDHTDGHQNPVFCGVEKSKSHVVDVDAEKDHKHTDIKDKTPNDLELEKYFNFNLFNGDGTIDGRSRYYWNNWNINTVLGSDGDVLGEGNNWSGEAAGTDKSGYHIWRYVTENTVSHDEYQTNAVSTGVVFKGKLLIDENDESVNEALRSAVNGKYKVPDHLKGKVFVYTVDGIDYPILYQFMGNLFVGWNNQVKTYSDERPGSAIYAAVYDKVDGGKSADELYQELVAIANDDNSSHEAIETALGKFRKAATAMGFTLYQASDDTQDYRPDQQRGETYGPGYYFYYYYWNRHNNNGRNGVMGPMEFAVVRNNVYKLSVTEIHSLGHPRISDNDPEKPTPDTPDEVGKLYFTVDVKVLPWTVRVNNIIF